MIFEIFETIYGIMCILGIGALIFGAIFSIGGMLFGDKRKSEYYAHYMDGWGKPRHW